MFYPIKCKQITFSEWCCWNYLYQRLHSFWATLYSIVMVPNKRSLHQALGSGLELGICIVYVSNSCDHWSSGCLKLFTTYVYVNECMYCNCHVNFLVISGSMKNKNIKTAQENCLILKGSCYIRVLYNKVLLYTLSSIYWCLQLTTILKYKL